MEDVINQLSQFVDQIGIQGFIIAGAVVAVIIIGYIFLKGIRLRKYRKIIVEIENNMNATKSLPLQYRLGRVHSISKNMPEVLEQYEEYAAEFERITDFQKNQLALLVNEVDEQLFYGKLSKVSKKVKELQDMLIIYENDSQALLTKIETITEIENVQRVEIIRVKEKYRKTIDEFEMIRFKVEEFAPDFLDLFNEVDDSFVKLESMMNNQLFEDAREFTKNIDIKVDWITSNMKDLPSYIAVVRQYIPKKVDYAYSLIESMSEDKFSLNQLDVTNRMNMIRTTLDESCQRIKKLELDSVGETLQGLVDAIDALTQDLEKEKSAFDEFKQKW
ncbi:MAG: septation ring formation regulator EzrA, partial [Coprobacillus sp.]